MVAILSEWWSVQTTADYSGYIPESPQVAIARHSCIAHYVNKLHIGYSDEKLASDHASCIESIKASKIRDSLSSCYGLSAKYLQFA